jgi:uncharacterized Zn finger protein (UPF0148 family)
MTRTIPGHCPECNASFLKPDQTLPTCPICAARITAAHRWRVLHDADEKMYNALVNPEEEKRLDAELDDMHDNPNWKPWPPERLRTIRWIPTPQPGGKV